MSDLALQKKLLVAESELNRIELKRELADLSRDLQDLTIKTNTLSTMVTSAKIVMTSLSSILHMKGPAHGGKPSWWQSLRGELALATALWKAFSPLAKFHGRDP